MNRISITFIAVLALLQTVLAPMAEAAAALGMTERHLRYKLKKYRDAEEG